MYTLSQMAFYFDRVLIIFHAFNSKRVHKRDDTVLLSGNILNTVVWKKLSVDCTAIISFKLITFCKTLLKAHLHHIHFGHGTPKVWHAGR